MLVRLLYVSRATESTTESLEAILQRARRHNAEHGITGILCYSNNIFMQLLEGSREEVNCLYSEIQRDSHHTITMKSPSASTRAGPWAWWISTSSTPPSS